jgi:hypothetical protein
MNIWLHGLLAALIGGAVNSLSVILVDPVEFNFSTGLGKLASVAGAGALIGVIAYLKKSPLPETSNHGQ